MTDINDPDQKNPRTSSLFVTSFEKGLLVLGAFSRLAPLLGMRDLMTITGLDQSAVQRFTHTLQALGFLKKDQETKKFSLTPKVLELGFSYLQSNSLIESVTPLLYELNAKWKESFNLTEMSGSDVVYVARVPGQHTISVDILLGTRMPAFAAAPGRAMLGFMERKAVSDILGASDLRKLTSATVIDRAALAEIFADVRRLGFSLAIDQCYEGDLSAAVPIFDAAGRPLAALNVSVPTTRWEAAAVIDTLVPELISAASTISRSHGLWRSHPWFAASMPAKAK